MNGAHIEVYNRYTRAIEREPVYGERWLRWTYETGLGQVALGLLVRRALFSRWYGLRMDRPGSRRAIEGFIRDYGLDAAEFADAPGSFASFNDFFSRRLQPKARPVHSDAGSVVFPADGRHLGFSDISATDRFYAKGQSFDIDRLLGGSNKAHLFHGGSMVISRLCPIDYHRFHFPCAGEAGPPRVIDGHLFSVSPIALRRRIEYLVENKRVVTGLTSDLFGELAIVEVGATCVGTIVMTAGAGRVEKGQEKGFFRFGGSCVITLFERGRVRLADDLLEQSRAGRELYARVGDFMGTAPEK